MNQEEIKTFLPHREPMLLIEDVAPQEEGSVLAHYRIPDKPFYCEGHFPGNPIVPGVILCEIMAQACFVLHLDALKNSTLLYRGMNNVKFRSVVKPGDACVITARLVESKGNLYVCDAQLSVAGKRCCQGTLTIATVPAGD